LHQLRFQQYEAVADVAVCRDGKLVGMVRIENVLTAPAATLVREMMDADPPVVAPGLDQEQVAWKAVRHRERSLAVADADGRFRGIVPPERLLAVAMTLQWALEGLGRDPAFGSGPLATVIQDLLSIVIYFGIATALV